MLGKKSPGIGVDGHDVLLIPHTPNASPHPTNSTWGGAGREGGARGVGGVEGWCGALGGGVLEEYRVHMHTYTHVGTRITVGKQLEIKNQETIFNYFP